MNDTRITEEDALRLELIASRRATLAAQAQALVADEALLHAAIKARYGLDDGDKIDIPSRVIARCSKGFVAGISAVGDPIGTPPAEENR